MTQLMKVVDNGATVSVRPQPTNSGSGGSGLFALTPERWQMYKEVARHAFKSGLFGNLKSEDAAITVMLQGVELGLQPMAAINNIYIVNGRPSLKAQLMAAIIVKAGHPPVKTIKSDSKECVVRFQRAGVEPVDVSFTIEQATKAKLAGKDVWQSYPEDMLWNRAVARGARRVFPELFAGLYTVEEMQDLATTQALEEAKTETTVMVETGQSAEIIPFAQAPSLTIKMTPDMFTRELDEIGLIPADVTKHFGVKKINDLVKGLYRDTADPLKEILRDYIKANPTGHYTWDNEIGAIVKMTELAEFEPEPQPVRNCPECDGPVQERGDGAIVCTAKGCGWFEFSDVED